MKRQAFSVFAVVMAAFSPAAAAQEICVSCSGPPATYRCSLDEASKVEGLKYGKRVLQFVCITELAKQGGHEKCRVQRSGSDGCFGHPRTVSVTGSIEGMVAGPDRQGGEEAANDQAVAETPEPKKEGPPKTVEELARRTASASKGGVGNAVKKSWGCIASLFKDC